MVGLKPRNDLGRKKIAVLSSEDSVNCSVAFKVEITKRRKALIIQVFCRHLMFIRGQLPIPYRELKRGFTEDQKPSQKQRKLKKLVQALDSFSDSVVSLLSKVDVRQIVFLLGASVNNPREVYAIEFSESFSSDTDTNSPKDNVRETSITEAVSRKFVLALINSCSDMSRMESTVTRMHVLLQPKAEECDLANIGWLPKRNFSLQEVRIRTGPYAMPFTKIKVSRVGTAPVFSSSKACTTDCLSNSWYYYSIPVKGIS